MLEQQGSLRCLVECNCCWCISPSGQVAYKTNVRSLEVNLLGHASSFVCIPFPSAMNAL